MAKLPTRDDLGGLPSARTGRAIATYDVSAASRGAQATLRALDGLGSNLMNIGADYMKLHEQQQAHEAEVKWQQFEFDADREFEERSQNVDRDSLSSFAGDYDQGYGENSNKFIDDNVPAQLADKFRARALASRRKRFAGAFSYQRGQQKSLSLMDLKQSGLAHQQRAMTYSSPSEINQSATALLDQIMGDPNLSPIEREQAVLEQFNGLAKSYITGRLAAGEDISDVLTGINLGSQSNEKRLLAFESGGNPRIVNSLGYTGLYQHGAPRLQTVGVYTPGRGENMKNWSTTSKNTAGKWSGEFNIPGFPKVKTHADYLKNPKAQRAVQRMHMKAIDKEIDDQGLNDYIGEVIDGVTVTRDGMRNAAHLAGTGSVKKKNGLAGWLLSGGVKNPNDINGTTITKYMALGSLSRGGSSPVFAALDPQTIAAYKEKNTANQIIVKAHDAADNAINVQPEDPLGAIGAMTELTPEVREKAEKRVVELEKRKKIADEEEQVQLTQDFYEKIREVHQEGADTAAIQREINLSDLEPDRKDALLKRADQGPRLEDDSSVAGEILQQSYTDPAAFAQRDLSKDLPYLTPGTFEKFERKQAAIKNPKAPTRSNLMTANKRLDNALRRMGFKVGAKADSKDIRMSRELMAIIEPQLEAMEAEKKAKLSGSEIQGVIDDAIITFEKDGSGWFSDDWKLDDVTSVYRDLEENFGLESGALLNAAVVNLNRADIPVTPENLYNWHVEWLNAQKKGSN